MAESLRPVPPPAFFLARTGADGAPMLLEEELEHVRVLRMSPGDHCLGFDGRGGRWPLRIEAIAGRSIRVAAEGPPEFEPEPGSPGASLPWIEVAVAWPRRNRAEPMLGSLVQLGAAAILPLDARFRGPEPCPAHPPERWEKLAREACKQCGRAWLPELAPAATIEDLARRAGALAVLDPLGGMSFDTWLRSLLPAPLSIGSKRRPLVIAIGPEGGFAPEERSLMLERGASPVRLGPHVLRVETAAVAAMAVAATVLGRPGRAV